MAHRLRNVLRALARLVVRRRARRRRVLRLASPGPLRTGQERVLT